MNFFNFSHFLLYWNVYFSPRAMGDVKSSSTDYESNKPNPKSLAYTGSKKLLVELGVRKNELFHFFFTFFALLKSLLFHPKLRFPKTHHKYYNVLKWERRFTYGVNDVKNTDYFKKCFKWKFYLRPSSASLTSKRRKNGKKEICL